MYAVLFLAPLFLGLALPASTPVTVIQSEPSGSALGTIVTFEARVVEDDEGSEPMWYRFRARKPGGEFELIRDFGPGNSLTWSSIDKEGTYEIEIAVRNLLNDEVITTTREFVLTPRVEGTTPVLTQTGHPLVMLYSAPACESPGRMRVEYSEAGGEAQNTLWKDCADHSMNFYLAGLKPDTRYVARQVMMVGAETRLGPERDFTTLPIDAPIGPSIVTQRDAAWKGSGALLQSTISQIFTAVDLEGNTLWYCPCDQTLTSVGPAGTFVALSQFPAEDASRQTVREFDLLGLTVQETNAARVNEQLLAQGKRPITSFHHEAKRLPDGKLLVLAASEEMVTDLQGEGMVDVIGDTILVLNRDLEVIWSWDSFDHMDLNRLAVLRETCTKGQGGCPVFYQSDKANDWLHSNAVSLTPDGNLLLSMRHQDWVIKIDYRNGEGDGHVIWRLGEGGDFAVESREAAPWFSHQHDSRIEVEDPTMLLLFDNSNIRRLHDPGANSRGQVWKLDEEKMTARLVMNADLGVYAGLLGSAQKLENGNYHFLAGWIGQGESESMEVDANGQVVYRIRSTTAQYRSFRLRDLFMSRE